METEITLYNFGLTIQETVKSNGSQLDEERRKKVHVLRLEMLEPMISDEQETTPSG